MFQGRRTASWRTLFPRRQPETEKETEPASANCKVEKELTVGRDPTHRSQRDQERAEAGREAPEGRRDGENRMGQKEPPCFSVHICCFSSLGLSRFGEQLSLWVL
jgi:hypothetical protein